MAAGGVQPGHADAVAFLDPGNAGADLGDIPDTFMAGDERERGLDRPVAIGRMQVGMANAGSHDPHENLAGRDFRHIDFLNDQGLAEGMDNGRFHFFRHDALLG